MQKVLLIVCLLCAPLTFLTSCQKTVDNSADIDALKASVATLQAKVDSLTKALNNTNATVTNLSLGIDSIKIQLAFITNQITQLNTQLTTVNANISAINSQILLLNQLYADLLAKLNDILAQLSVTCTTLSNGLVAWFPFTGTADDSSGNGNNGTLSGPKLTADRFGNPNRAYIFNGSADFITIADNASLKPASSISLAAWVLIDSTGTANFQRILSKQQNQPQNYASYQLITGNRGVDSLGYPGFTLRTSSSYQWTGHSGSRIVNKWVHICGTWDGTYMKFYQNGKLVATIVEGGNILYDTESLYVGRGTDGNGLPDYFKGNIDEVRIYNRALTQNEISYLATH